MYQVSSDASRILYLVPFEGDPKPNESEFFDGWKFTENY